MRSALLPLLAVVSAAAPPPQQRRPDPTAFIEAQIEAGNIPGCSVAVTVGDELA